MNKNKILSNKDFYNLKESVDHYTSNPEIHPKEELAFSYLPEQSLILDIGCGAGRTTSWLNQHDYRVIGMDISHNMVKQAGSQHPEIPFLAGDAVNLPCKSDSIDAVIFSFNGLDTIHPYQLRIEALKEIKRVLKQNGLFIFSAHNHCIPTDMEGVIPFAKSLFKKNRDCYIRSTFESKHFLIYLTTPANQIQELDFQGFELIDIVPRRILRPFKQFKTLLSYVDNWIYYVCKNATK